MGGRGGVLLVEAVATRMAEEGDQMQRVVALEIDMLCLHSGFEVEYLRSRPLEHTRRYMQDQ